MLSLLLSTPGFYIYVAFLVVVLLAALWVEKPQRLRCTRGPRLAARRSRVPRHPKKTRPRRFRSRHSVAPTSRRLPF
jgi:hypothetical protein